MLRTACRRVCIGLFRTGMSSMPSAAKGNVDARLPRKGSGKSARPAALRSWELCSRRLPTCALPLEESANRRLWSLVETVDGGIHPGIAGLVRSPWRARPFGRPSGDMRRTLGKECQALNDAMHQVMTINTRLLIILSTVTLDKREDKIFNSLNNILIHGHHIEQFRTHGQFTNW